LGGTAALPGSLNIAAINADSFLSTAAWPNASYFRCTNSGTFAIETLMNLPAALITGSGGDRTHNASIKIVNDAGSVYYLMATTTAP
jgi:hypothetical protein